MLSVSEGPNTVARQRKLAAIFCADIAGFSRLTAQDEDWTISTLHDFRSVIDELIARHNGRIFNTGGDSVLAEFASPVEAVRCAVDFQEALGAPMVISGIEQADAAIHSPNEHLQVDQYHRGIEALIRFICLFGGEPAQQ